MESLLASIWSYERRSDLQAAARSALEGGALTGAAALVLWWALSRELFAPASAGLASAWAASTVSVAAMILARGRSWKAFWWAFGGGVALRATVFVVLVAWAWSAGWPVQAAMWCAYALGVLLLLQLEYRHLLRK